MNIKDLSDDDLINAAHKVMTELAARLEASNQEHVSLVDQLTEWEHVTGFSTPDEYQTAKDQEHS